MSREKYRLTTVQDGSRTSDEEEFSTLGSAVNHLFKLEKRNLLEKIQNQISAKIAQAERKSEKDLRHYDAVMEGLKEALAIVEKEWK